MEPTVVELDPEDSGPLMQGALAVENARLAELDPEHDPMNEAAYRARLASNDTISRRVLLALVDDRVIGTAAVDWWAIEGNTDKLETDVHVLPDHRRRGIGTALLRRVLDAADELDRTAVMAWGPLTDTTRAFWEHAGLSFGQTERRSRLWLADTDPDLMAEWVARRIEHAGDYHLVHWRGPTPSEHVDAMVTLMTAMNDAPDDDLDYADDIWTADDIAGFTEWRQMRGLDSWTSIVVAPDGEPAGLTTVAIQRHLPRFSFQDDTVVIAEHRGRGIGRWLKADMWQRLRADAPEVEALDTENAESNDPMLAINVAMGFRPVLQSGAWQGSVADIREALGPQT